MRAAWSSRAVSLGHLKETTASAGSTAGGGAARRSPLAPGRMTGMAKAADRWHRWLMDGRFGGDPAARDRLLTELLYRRAAAAAEGLLDRCRFLVASADSLDGIADASVDVVT